MGGNGPLSGSEAAKLFHSDWGFSESRHFSVVLSATELVICLGSFMTNKLALLDSTAVDRLLKEIANLYLASASSK